MFAGVLFWKHPRRKLYAVAQKDLRGRRQSRSSSNYTIDSSDDESDVASSICGSTCKKPRLDKMVEAVGHDVSAIREIVTDMMTLTANCNLPLG